ncbi:signal peptide protein [Chengkuizengella axinellae]|uniref:Signal peptide protein n=1 Tax=Chengkuizengella axinellae TaxID=3064388 RepID=A0ABT9J0W0_9BACL|nr:signal peptide protein [Chengkuizengella sp. 2205SS18-9]MDP5274649.1 signal peptide protein [Chengkuizengella sp. 2205SS18-9]
MNRLLQFIIFGLILLIAITLIGNLFDREPSEFETSSNSESATVSSSAVEEQESSNTLPWDYRVEEGTVGDLIGGDMTVLPDNLLLPNDENYATGDKIWTLQYMNAQMKVLDNGSNEVLLSSWKGIKSYKSLEEAEKDLADLKVQIKTEVDLVGVYKTEFEGEFRQFAILTLPTGHDIKQPIDEERYNNLKSEKKVEVYLEEVHSYTNYDMAMAKFRGWVE